VGASERNKLSVAAPRPASVCAAIDGNYESNNRIQTPFVASIKSTKGGAVCRLIVCVFFRALLEAAVFVIGKVMKCSRRPSLNFPAILSFHRGAYQ
jgi:hypothetical protein